MRGIAICIVLAACSFPEKHGGAPGDGRSADSGNGIDSSGIDTIMSIDAPAGGPFACIGQPFPTTAPPQILFQGSTMVTTTFNPNGMPVPNATVRVYSQTNGQQYVNTITNGQGTFNATALTNGTAIDGPIEMDPPPSLGYAPTLLYPRQPFHSDQINLLLQTYDQQSIAVLYQQANVPYNSQSATMIAQIVDCNGAPVPNAQLLALPGNTPPVAIRYLVNGTFDPNATATDGSGYAVALGMPPGGAQFTATTTVGQFHSYRYTYPPAAMVYASIQP